MCTTVFCVNVSVCAYVGVAMAILWSCFLVGCSESCCFLPVQFPICVCLIPAESSSSFLSVTTTTLYHFSPVHHHGSKMLRSESNSSITQSPLGWQISHFLTLLHEPSGMCVCISVCVRVFTCACLCVCVCMPFGVPLTVNGVYHQTELHSHSPVIQACVGVPPACSGFFNHLVIPTFSSTLPAS